MNKMENYNIGIWIAAIVGACIGGFIIKYLINVNPDPPMNVDEEYADGEAVGKLKGKIDSLLEILEELGDIPEALQTRIQSEKDLQVLTSWLKAAAKADSIEEFQEKAGLL